MVVKLKPRTVQRFVWMSAIEDMTLGMYPRGGRGGNAFDCHGKEWYTKDAAEYCRTYSVSKISSVSAENCGSLLVWLSE